MLAKGSSSTSVSLAVSVIPARCGYYSRAGLFSSTQASERMQEQFEGEKYSRKYGNSHTLPLRFPMHIWFGSENTVHYWTSNVEATEIKLCVVCCKKHKSTTRALLIAVDKITGSWE